MLFKMGAKSPVTDFSVKFKHTVTVEVPIDELVSALHWLGAFEQLTLILMVLELARPLAFPRVVVMMLSSCACAVPQLLEFAQPLSTAARRAPSREELRSSIWSLNAKPNSMTPNTSVARRGKTNANSTRLAPRSSRRRFILLIKAVVSHAAGFRCLPVGTRATMFE
jgi:hypothetical protein